MPEDRKQMEALFQKLAGNKAFARHRGDLSLSAERLLKMGTNPSSFCKEFDEWAASVRVLGNMLHTLKRDGQEISCKELETVLDSSSYIMKYEEIPIHETVPYTVVFPAAKKTIAIIKWFTHSPWDSLREYVTDGKTEDPNVIDVIGLFPSMSRHVESFLAYRYGGRGIQRSMQEEIPRMIDRLSGETVHLGLAWGQWDFDNELQNIPVAYFTPEDQTSVLKRFTREEQKQIATWQFNIPKFKIDNLDYFRVGFHEESEHDEHCSSAPSTVSKGCQFGLGARMVNRDDITRGNSGYSVAVNSRGTSDGIFRFMLSTIK